MRILAIDTALEACSCAILDTTDGGILASATRPMQRGHAETLVPLIAETMKRLRLSFVQIDRVAVTTGPGSFTGLRVGLAAARGIGLAAARPVIGLTTLAALAAPHIAEDDTVSIVVAIDARHDHVYLQVFGPGGRVVVTPRIVPAQEAAHALLNGPARLVGSGAALVVQRASKQPVLIDDRRFPDIDWVARLGAAANETQSPPKPLYLRAPDAQPQSAAQLPRR